MSSEIFDFGEFILNAKRKQLFNKSTGKVKLTPKSLKLLHFLIVNKGTTFSTSELLDEDRLWGSESFVERGNVGQTISMIRKALNDQKEPYRFVETVNAGGYCFIGSLTIISESEFEKLWNESNGERHNTSPTVENNYLDSASHNIVLTAPIDALELTSFSTTETESQSDTPSPTEESLNENEELNADNVEVNQNDSLSKASLAQSVSNDENEKKTETDKTDDLAKGMDTFYKWMRNYGKNITIATFTILLLSFGVSLVFSFFYSAELVKRTFSISHLIIIAISLGYLWIYPAEGNFPPNKGTEEQKLLAPLLEKYKESWQILLFFWIILYLIVAFLPENSSTNSATNSSRIIIAINNINSLLLFNCFYTLNKSNPVAKNYMIIIDIVAGLIIFGVFLSGQEIASDKMLKLFSGITAGVCMALYFGQFQSKFLKAPQWLMVLFYSYALIQPTFEYFGEVEYEKIIIPVALILKSFLILYMFWLFDSKRLLYYFVRKKRTEKQVEDEYREFLKNWKK